MDEENVVVLMDEEGEEKRFSFLDLIEYEHDEYVILLPIDSEEDNDAGEVVILRVEETEDNEGSYVSVDNNNTLLQVYEIFKEKFKQEFEFVD